MRLSPCRARSSALELVHSLALASALAVVSLLPVHGAADARSASGRFAFQPDDPTRAVLVVEIPTVAWEQSEAGFVPRLAGYGPLAEWGLPDLPLRVERVALEEGQSLVIESTEIVWHEGRLPGLVRAYPAGDPTSPSLGADAPLASDGPWPTTPVRLRSQDGALRDQRFASIEIAPVQVDLANASFRIARRIEIALRFEGGSRARLTAPRDASSLLARVAAESIHGAPVARGEASTPALRPLTRSSFGTDAGSRRFQFRVDREGLYRVTHAWLQTNAPALLAFLQAEDPRRIRITTQGVEVPIRVEGESDGVFGTGDAIVFFGQPVEGDPFSPDGWQGGDFTDVNVYVLDLADDPARVTDDALVAPPTIGVVPPSFRETARYEDNRRFTAAVPNVGGDHWVAEPFLLAGSTETLDQPVPTPGHVGGLVRTRVRLMGFDRLHQTQIRVDGTLRDTKDWNGLVDFTHDVTFDRTSTPLGATTLVNVTITNARSSDQVAVNWAEVEYDRAYQANQSRLDFDVANTQSYEVRLGGFTAGVEVWEITASTTSGAGLAIRTPRRVEGLALRDGKPAFNVLAQAAPRRFFAAEGAGFLTPASVREDLDTAACAGGSLLDVSCGARWVVIGPAALVAGPNLAALAARREAQGYPSAIIDVQDIYDEFSFGVSDPEAIRRFVDHALPGGTSGGWSPAPDAIVLVGDATYDYKNNYQHTVDRNLLSSYTYDYPSHPNYKLYASDVWFATVRGADDLPDALVGRIPAHDLSEAESVFAKILDYESFAAPAPWRGRALMVSESPDTPSDVLGNEFRRVHDEQYTRWFQDGPQTASKIYESEPWLSSCTAAADAQNASFDAASNAGAAITTFLGHGSFRSWGRACTFFETAPPAQQLGDDLNDLLPGTALQFHIHANCITGAFSATSSPGSSNDSWYAFMEDWLLTSDKGAVGGIAPSHLSFDLVLEPIIAPVYEQLLGRTKERTAGIIDLTIRESLDIQNFETSVRSLIFFGDPLTTIAIPRPSAPTVLSVEPDGSKALEVRWSSVPGTDTYRVYRAGLASGPYTLAGTVPGSSTSFRDTGLDNCREYFYYVVAVDGQGFESSWSNFNDTCYLGRDPDDCKWGIPEDPDPPPAPSWPSGAAGEPEPVEDLRQGGRLKVTWKKLDPIYGVVRYTVRWGTTSGGPFTSSTSTNGTNDFVVVGGLDDGTRYYFVVHAESCSETGPPSAERSGVPHLVRGIDPPGPIGDLFVEYVDDSSNGANDGAKDTRLTWSPPVQSAWGLDTSVASFEVYGSAAGPAFRADATTRLATLGAAVTTWTHELAPGSPPNWYYVVVAVDPAGLRSPYGSAFPESVTDLRVRRPAGQATELDLLWTGVSGGLNGSAGPTTVEYRVHGRASMLPRAECSDVNRLTIIPSIGPGSEHRVTVPLPTAPYYTYQVLSADSKGTEAVW